MDKETLSQYGWIVVVIIILVIMIALASPFGNYVADTVTSTYTSFKDTTDEQLIDAGLMDEKPATFKAGVKYHFLDGSKSYFIVKDAEDDSDAAIVLHLSGTSDIEIPKTCVERTDTTMVLTNTGSDTYNGTYTIYPDGFVEKDGSIIAKSEEKWVDLKTGNYLITCGKDVYTSTDGNTPQYSALSYSDVQNYYNAFSSDASIVEAMEKNYTYKFKSFTLSPDGLTLRNALDTLAMSNISRENGTLYFVVCWKYLYFGGTGFDTLSDNTIISNIFWSTSNVTKETRNTIYKIGNDGSRRKVDIDDVICGVYELVTTEQYYYKGTKTNNIVFANDYAFSYEPGMTGEQWMNSEYYGNGNVDDKFGDYTAIVPVDQYSTPIENVVFEVVPTSSLYS